MHSGPDAVDQCKGTTVPDCQFKGFRWGLYTYIPRRDGCVKGRAGQLHLNLVGDGADGHRPTMGGFGFSLRRSPSWTARCPRPWRDLRHAGEPRVDRTKLHLLTDILVLSLEPTGIVARGEQGHQADGSGHGRVSRQGKDRPSYSRRHWPNKSLSGRNMHVGRTSCCLSQAAGVGRTIEYCDFPGPSRSRWGSPVSAHRNRLHALDALGVGMGPRRFVRGGWRAGTHDHHFA